MAKLEFEDLETNQGTFRRARAPNGWVLKMGAGLIFVPDPEHKWI